MTAIASRSTNFLKKYYTNVPLQVLAAAILGIIVGIFFGDYCKIFRPIGTIYIMLLQVVVYPYIIATLITSLGELTAEKSLKLFLKSWYFYLLLLFLVFGTIAILSYAIPSISSKLGNLVVQNNPPSFLGLIIPENIFYSLSNNFVPAVIIFCILFGITLQRIKTKYSLIEILKTISSTSIEYWRWLVKLAPIATFAMIADVAGTIQLSQLIALSEYMVLFFVGTFSLTFWLIPAFISALTGIKYKVLIKKLYKALVISAATTLSVLALTYIFDAVKELLQERKKETLSEQDIDIVNMTLLVSYPLGQLGNFFIYLFILFSALYFVIPILIKQKILLFFATFLSSIGSPSSSVSAVSFLSSWLDLPVEITNLYVSISPITRYGQVLISVMGFAFITITSTFSYFGLLKISYKKLFMHLILGVLIFSIVASIMSHLTPDPSLKIYNRLNQFSVNESLTRGVQVKIMPLFDERSIIPAIHPEDSLYRIQRTGILRVGFNANVKPFVFYNQKGKLVGYDVSYIYALAQALNAKKIEFYPYTWTHLITDLQANKFDIAIGGIYVSSSRLEQVYFSEPYFHSTISFIVPQNNQLQFKNAESIRNIINLTIAVHNSPLLIDIIQKNFPNAKIITMNVASQKAVDAFAENKIDAVMWSNAQTTIWALGHPGYISIAPSGISAPLLMSFAVQTTSPELLRFLNYWMTLKKNEGFNRSIYNQWILALPIETHQPRWSIWQNVFHFN